MTQTDAQTLQESSRFLWGASVWQVRFNIRHCLQTGYSYASLEELWIDFHEPLAVPEKNTKYRTLGSVRVNAWTAGARLEKNGKMIVASGDAATKVVEELPKMIGFRLLRIEIQSPGGDTCFVFENEFVLTCFPATQAAPSWAVCTTD
jgi:hypothetical protein